MKRPETKQPKQYDPKRLFTLVAVSIFVVEFGIMLIFQYLFHPIPPLENLLDASSLVIITYPILFSYFFKPMMAEMATRKTAERELLFRMYELKDSAVALENEKMQLAKVKAEDEAMLDNIADGVIAVDSRGKIVLINRAAQTMLQCGSEESLGKKWAEVLLREDKEGKPLPPGHGAIAKALSDGTVTNSPGVYIRKDKVKFPVFRTVSPVILNGETIGAINVFRDITKEDEIDRSKSEFVSLVSHQLRTPTTAISWFSKMLLNQEVGEVNSEQKRYLQNIYDGNKRMIELIGSLLDVSRIELGTFPINPEVVSLPDVCNNVIAELKSQIEAKKITIAPKYQPALPKILADPKLIYIIFQNLLTNAVSYSHPKGKIEVGVSIKRDKDEDYYQISVKDTGIGISTTEKDQIFTKLFRTDSAKVMISEGMGLGLHIVKSILARTGGVIWFESEENKGSTFYVKLPLGGMKQQEKGKPPVVEISQQKSA